MNVDLTDLRKFDRVNLWPSGSGLSVRPGLRQIVSGSATIPILGGFSVKADSTDEVRHYVLFGGNSAVQETAIIVYDEVFSALQTRYLGTYQHPRVFSLSAGNGEILFGSPDLEPQFAFMGDYVRAAEKYQPADLFDTAFGIPRGICTSWAGRTVVADGSALFFSEPLRARTFVGDNVLVGPWESNIYGLLVSAEGALIVGSGTGIYMLPEDAASGAQVTGAWSKLTDIEVLDYNCMCTARGIIYALTRDGVRQVYPPGPEIGLSQQPITRYYGPPIIQDDYREGRIFGTSWGPIVNIQDALWVLSPDGRHYGWWTNPQASTFEVRGVLRGHYGEEMLICEDGIYQITGNFDGAVALTSEDASVPTGLFAGRLETDPDENPSLIASRFASDTGGSVVSAVRGDVATAQTPQQGGIVIGTDSWGDGNYYRRPSLEPVRTMWASQRSRDLSIEVGATRPDSRVGTSVHLEFSEVGRRRPT